MITRRELFMLGVASLLSKKSRAQVWSNPLVEQEVPPFLLEDVNPHSATYGEFVGPQLYERSLVTFWAPTICVPCREEIANLEHIHNRYAIPTLVVDAEPTQVGKSREETFDAYSQLMRQSGLSLDTFPGSLLGPRGLVPETTYSPNESLLAQKGTMQEDMGFVISSSTYGIIALPNTFLVENQRIVANRIGNLSGSPLEERIRR